MVKVTGSMCHVRASWGSAGSSSCQLPLGLHLAVVRELACFNEMSAGVITPGRSSGESEPGTVEVSD
jgi:hypothetical protein